MKLRCAPTRALFAKCMFMGAFLTTLWIMINFNWVTRNQEDLGKVHRLAAKRTSQYYQLPSLYKDGAASHNEPITADSNDIKKEGFNYIPNYVVNNDSVPFKWRGIFIKGENLRNEDLAMLNESQNQSEKYSQNIPMLKPGRKNRFHYSTSKIYGPNLVNDSIQLRFVRDFMGKRLPMGHDRHLQFIDFEDFGFHNPIYINMVRDPMNRTISSFYYRRRKRVEAPSLYSEIARNRTLDECMEVEGMSKCLVTNSSKDNIFNPVSLYVSWFCGQHEECRMNRDYAMARAKRNIIKYYRAVGITEEFRQSLELLEATLPSYFQGAVRRYDEMPKKNVNMNKLQYPTRTEKEIRYWLKDDYEMYNFIKERFYKVLKIYFKEDLAIP
ncbi:unnamed protein product [Owenia fusiformis]|uniref:Heparan sulfate 2-O-sulfotransferase pipe n=1 Tax=Owenia fusiformis TaxID=6347 RepID=A0A8S4NQ48_OWEFU|nr:unnamed protein product [Owenia fusiformis]